jgi:tRNA pseudouridine32 synthase/23S rRNA pseudouridine746 synthase
MKEPLLFENEHFLVVDKQPGFLSVPSRLGSEDTRPCEIKNWSEQKKIRLWAVHRLDEEVSGILLFAKTAQAHRLANGWFENRQVKKTYEAFTPKVGSAFAPFEKRLWKSKLLRGKKRAYEKDFGKEALTEATFVKDLEFNSNPVGLWQLSPLTGRSHQLRFELSKHGFPVLGDELYGSTEEFGVENAIALRAVHLDLLGCPGREGLGLPGTLETLSLESWSRGVKRQ